MRTGRCEIAKMLDAPKRRVYLMELIRIAGEPAYCLRDARRCPLTSGGRLFLFAMHAVARGVFRDGRDG